MRRFFRGRGAPGKYAGSLELIDERTQDVLVACDLSGKATLTAVEFVEGGRASWRMEPNRKLMPSRWILRNPAGEIAIQFEQTIPRKLANPLHRVILSLCDGSGREIHRLVDPRGGLLEGLFLGPDEWALMEGGKLVAKVVRLRRATAASGGILARLKDLLSTSDTALVSLGSQHVLPAPQALGMLLLTHELASPDIS